MAASQTKPAPQIDAFKADTPAQRAKAALVEAGKAGAEAAQLFLQDLDRLIASAEEIASLGKVLPAAFTDQVGKLGETLRHEYAALAKANSTPPKKA